MISKKEEARGSNKGCRGLGLQGPKVPRYHIICVPNPQYTRKMPFMECLLIILLMGNNIVILFVCLYVIMNYHHLSASSLMVFTEFHLIHSLPYILKTVRVSLQEVKYLLKQTHTSPTQNMHLPVFSTRMSLLAPLCLEVFIPSMSAPNHCIEQSRTPEAGKVVISPRFLLCLSVPLLPIYFLYFIFTTPSLNYSIMDSFQSSRCLQKHLDEMIKSII